MTGLNAPVFARRYVVILLKNVADERITQFEDGDLIMPEGDGDDQFFFPISQKLPVEATLPEGVSFEVTDDRFTVRYVNFSYLDAENQADSGTDRGPIVVPHPNRVDRCMEHLCR